jgi:hypothetical protein
VTLELTEQQQQLLQQSDGKPIEMVDPHTHARYILIASAQYEQIRTLLDGLLAKTLATPPAIPEGIQRSQQALRNALPGLLERRNLRGQWAAYHGDVCIGYAPTEAALLGECARRGLKDDQYYIGWIDPSELIEEEELEPRPWHNGQEGIDEHPAK